jgi:hypothetical protein
MHVVIFETEHFEAVYPVIRLFDCNEHTITIFCYQNTYHQLQHMLGADFGRYTWIVKPEAENKIRFIYTLFRYTKQHETAILYLNTISNNFLFYGLLVKYSPAKRIIVTAHIINNLFEKGKTDSFKARVRQWGKNYLLPKVKEFNVIASTLLPALQHFSPLAKIHGVPGGIYEAQPDLQQEVLTDTLRLVIPGSIDKKRRDYDSIIQLARQLEAAGINTLVTLLGKPMGDYGESIIAQINRLPQHYVSFITFDTEVAQDKFDQHIRDAHFILSPLVTAAVFDDGIEETYGKTICSGNISDIIRHVKPFILPSHIALEAPLSTAGFTYTDTDMIVAYLKQVVQEPGLYDSHVQKLQEAVHYYTVEAVRERNPTLLQQ